MGMVSITAGRPLGPGTLPKYSLLGFRAGALNSHLCLGHQRPGAAPATHKNWAGAAVAGAGVARELEAARGQGPLGARAGGGGQA